MSLFVDYLKSLPVYQDLLAAFPGGEGNLLENVSDATSREAQVEFLRWALRQADPYGVVETGTNKGLFGLLLANVQPHAFELNTFDVDVRSGACVGILQAAYQANRFGFWPGDTKETLPQTFCLAESPLHDIPGFAWVDGGHDFETAFSDIHTLMLMRVPWIACDDTQYQSVRDAIDRALSRHPQYEQLPPHPWAAWDAPGAVLLRRV